MTTTSELQDRLRAKLGSDIPDPVLHVFRGIGQVFFQENALTGACFVLGIAFSSPLDGDRRRRRLGDRHGDGPAAQVRQVGAARRDLRLQLHPGRDRHALLLPAGRGEPLAADRRLRRGGARDLADAAVRAVSDLHHAVHRHDLGPVLPGAGPGRGPGRAGRAAGRRRLRRGRGPRRQPGDVPGEHLDGAAVPHRHRPERLAARVVGAGAARSSACWWGATTRPRRRGPSTPRAWSNGPCSRTSRWGSTATTRRWRPSPCSCGGGR